MNGEPQSPTDSLGRKIGLPPLMQGPARMNVFFFFGSPTKGAGTHGSTQVGREHPSTLDGEDGPKIIWPRLTPEV